MFRPLLSIAIKDLRLLARNRSACFFTLVWPLAVAILFGAIFGGSGDKGKLQIGVVDEDHTDGSRLFAGGLAAADEFATQPLARSEAIDRVRRGKLSAAVILPAGFGEAGARLFYGKPPAVELWIDPSRSADRAMLEGLLQRQAARRLSSVMTDPKANDAFLITARHDLESADAQTKADVAPLLDDLDHFMKRPPAASAPGSASGSTPTSAPAKPKAEWSPLSVESHDAAATQSGPRSAFEMSFPQGILWGLIGAVMSFAVGLATERTGGTMLRLRAAPLSTSGLLAGKGLGGFLGLLIVQGLLLTVAALVFGVRPSSVPMLLIAMFCIAVCFTGLMLFIATLGRNEQAVSGAGWALLMPLTLVGGGTIPLFAMPAWLVKVSHFSPMKWTVLSLEGALWRNFSLQEMTLPCAILLAVGLVAGWLGSRVIRAE